MVNVVETAYRMTEKPAALRLCELAGGGRRRGSGAASYVDLSIFALERRRKKHDVLSGTKSVS